MTTTYFAGVNTAALAAATTNRNVLISYADVVRRPGWWERNMRPTLEDGESSVILDSGAFTVISAGLSIDVHAYARFAAEHRHLFDVIVNLDDIAGDLATTWKNQAVLEAAGLEVLPVYHQGEPWGVLEHYLDRHDYVGVGFARRAGGRLAFGPAENEAFLKEFFARVEARGRGIRTHGFAMTRWASSAFPFTTTDSTTWIAEYRALRNQANHSTTSDVPALRPEGDHGISNDLANLFDWFEDAHLLELVLDSYDPSSIDASRAPEALVAEYAEMLESDAAGQARTVFRRYGARAFCAKVLELDEKVGPS